MFNKCKYIIICLIVSAAVSAADELTAHFLNVGHGDAIILQFPQGTVMLVDGGMPEYGEKVVDYLSDLGLSHYLDYIMLTHSHDDHVGGLNFILQNLTVGKVLLSEYSEPTELYQRFIFLVDSLQIPQRIVSRGDVLEIDSLNMEIINPPAGKTLEALRGPNGASIAMKIDIGETDMLFMADVDKMTDMEIVNEYGKGLEAAVLKAAHHGSGVSSTRFFLDAVKAKIAVVSTGASEWNYPSEETMERIKRYVPEVYRTDEAGDIIITVDGENITVETQ